MSASWIAPATRTYVDQLPELTEAGVHRTKTRKYTLAPCDVCWEPTWIADSDLKVTWKCPTCRRTSTRKLSSDTPICEGCTKAGQKIVHPPIEMTTADTNPGRPCRMTPRCPGRHRREGLDLRTKENG